MSITEGPRAGFYVDGFNLYHAIDELGKPYLKWVSLRRLAERVAKPFGAHVVETVFCTAFFPGDFDKKKRHEAYINAQKAEGTQVVLGHSIHEPASCNGCGREWRQPREKETDINVALSLFEAAKSERIDLAFLVTADTDQAATLKFLRLCCPKVEAVILTPPGRSTSSHLKNVAGRAIKLSETDIDLSVMPAMVMPPEGRLITRPPQYSPPSGWVHPDERKR